MDLHGQIMNIQEPSDRALGQAVADSRIEAPDVIHAYKCGHRDARHAAAEIALQGDKALDLLRRIIASAGECDVSSDGAGVPLAAIDYRLIEEAKEILK